MARIIKRISLGSGERDPNFGDLGSGTAGDGESLGSDSNPRTGEPDSDATTDTGNQRASGSGVNGNGTAFTDPASGRGSSSDSGGTTRRGRGRPRGSGGKSRTTPTQTTSDIAEILYTVHFGIANMFKSEMFAITTDESEKLARAITRVTELYEVRLLPEKQMAWLNLAMALGGVYGPRIAANSLKKKAAKKGPQIVDMPSPQAINIPVGESGQ